MPGSQLKDNAGNIIYTPYVGKEVISVLLTNRETYTDIFHPRTGFCLLQGKNELLFLYNAS